MKMLFVFMIMGACACSTPKEKIDTSTDLNCATGFIKNLYQGNFAICETVILSNADNAACLKKNIFNYNQNISKALKEKYKVASVILEREIVNDSISIINYKDPVANKNQPPLKVLKQKNNWLIDYAYTCSGNL
jgi:hypothetical protein